MATCHSKQAGTETRVRLDSVRSYSLQPIAASHSETLDYLSVDDMDRMSLLALSRHVCVLKTFTAEIRRKRHKAHHEKYISSAGEILARRILNGETPGHFTSGRGWSNEN